MQSTILKELLREADERPVERLFGNFGLALARVHEFCGLSRRTLALMLAGQMAGEVFWIAPGWKGEVLNGDAMARFAEPGRFSFVLAERPEDQLWAMEETLRSGEVTLVVADLAQIPGLTPMRRLQLAAEAGAQKGRRPLGVVLTPGEGGASGAETRWSLDAAHHERDGWVLRRRRARLAPEACFLVHPSAGKGFQTAPLPV